MISLKKMLTKILREISGIKQRTGFTCTVLQSGNTVAPSVSTDWSVIKSFPALAEWDVIAVRLVVHEQVNVFWIARGDNLDRGLTDWPAAGKFRGTFQVDWANTTIRMRAINAGSSNDHPELIYLGPIYGIVPKETT